MPSLLQLSDNPIFKWDIENCIKFMNEQTNNTPILHNKVIFKGLHNNDERRALFLAAQKEDFFEFSNEVIPFLDFAKYKYILDMHGGGDGCHRGRAYWLFHMNRVLFLPTDDVATQWFEELDNPPEPWVHYVPYSEKEIIKSQNIDTIKSAFNKLENDPELYETIRQNCIDYANKYLNNTAVEEFVIKRLTN